jgi:hypothetical protein
MTERLAVAIAPVNELQILGGKDEFLRSRNPGLEKQGKAPTMKLFHAVAALAALIPAAFFERSIEMKIRKRSRAEV